MIRIFIPKVIFLIIGLLIFTTVFACSGDKGGDVDSEKGSEAVAKDIETPESKPALDASMLDATLEKAWRLYIHDEFKDAETVCDAIFEIDRDNLGAIVIYGMSESGRGLYDIGNSYFAQAISRPAETPADYTYRGVAKTQIGDFKGAIADFDMAIDLDPTYSTAYGNRGIALMKSGNPDQAILDFDLAIDISPDYALAYFNRGRAYQQLDIIEAAIFGYEKALEIDPELVIARKALDALK